MRRRGLCVVIGAVALVACNGEDAGPATAPPIATTAPTTTSESTTTTSSTSTTTTKATPEETTTTAVATTAPPETTSDSTTPTTSDPDVDAAVQARIDVIEAVEASFQASIDVRRDPFDDEAVDALASVFTGSQLEGWGNIVERYRERNLRLDINPDQNDEVQVSLESLAINDDLDSSTVQVCEVLGGILVEVAGNDDGTDRVITDEVDRTVVELEVRREGDIWKVAVAREPEEQIATCV